MENNDLTAEQAREISKRPLCEKIFIEIKKASLEGYSSIMEYLTLKEEKHLKDLGYKVANTYYYAYFNPRLYEISWENNELTAKQAKDISVCPSFKKILKKIKKAALEGDSSILMYLTPREVKHLKNLGYKVTLTCFDPRLYEISWEN